MQSEDLTGSCCKDWEENLGVTSDTAITTEEQSYCSGWQR